MTSGTMTRKALPQNGNVERHSTKRELKPRPSTRKGRSSASRDLVHGVIRDVAGYAPYERRAMELIRNSKDKKVPLPAPPSSTLVAYEARSQARKLMKQRLGTLGRSKRKIEELTGVIAEARRYVAR
jgi:large subunit ribosomal protein L36e